MTSADDLQPTGSAAWINLRWLGVWPLPTVTFILMAIIYCLSLLPRTLWAENEAYYAMGAQNVLEGKILLPVIYDNMLSDKPPLMFWWIALISLPFGNVSEITARIANILPAFLILFIIYRFAKSVGLKAALLSTVVLATAHEFYEVTFEVNTDILLTAFLLISWIAMFKLMEFGFTWKRWLLLWIPMGLGLLTKGPIAPALSCLIAIAYAFPGHGWHGGWKRLFNLRPFTGAAICLLPFIFWCFAVYNQYGREPLDTILLRHNVQRFVEAFDHKKPWYYYLYTLPIVMLPWTLFMPVAAMQWWRAKKTKTPLPAWKTFALTVVATVFLVFSISSSKRAYYMLPLMPWLSLLLGDAMSHIGQGRENIRIQKWITVSAAGMLLLLFLYVVVGYPILDKHRSISELVQEVDRTTGHTDKLILFAEEDPRVMFYLRERMTYYADKPEANKQMAEILSETPKVNVLTLEEPLERLHEISPVSLYVKGSALYRKNRFYVLTTEPGKGLPPFTPEFIKRAKARDDQKKNN